MVLIRSHSVDSTDSRQEVDLRERDIASCKKLMKSQVLPKPKPPLKEENRERERTRDNRDRRRDIPPRRDNRDRDRGQRNDQRPRPRGPAGGDECFVCGQVGHIARNCSKRSRR
eukprot:TRINITY_DN9460_c0_g1_i1.p1 TRINITY_DN9460_c0_g1~~TRINITY_DN9460_c0_g1_i1.p1  ORF type:complete len:129 (+),score=19.18 TRINITY_DN9460_c0_g1_i1:48-389(+)